MANNSENDEQHIIRPEDPLPSWVLAIVRLGVISAIALWFVYRVTTVFENRLTTVEKYMHENNSMVTQLRDSYLRHETESQEQINISRQICVNTARTDEQRTQCLR